MAEDYVDPIAEMHARLRAERLGQPRTGVRRPSIRENAKYPLSYVAAFAVGVAATAFGRYCQFHMLGLPAQAENPDMQLVMDNVFAGLVAVVIRLATSFSTREHMIANMAGVWMVIVLFHNMAHWAPEPMALLFSRDYVREVQAATDGNSILFRGAEFHFGEGPVFERK